PERRQRSQAGSVRGARMHNLDTPRTEVAAQSQYAARVGLERGCARQELDTLRGHALGQWFAGTRRHDRNVLATRQLGSQPERLPLAAAPTTLGIDVKDAHQRGRGLRASTG